MFSFRQMLRFGARLVLQSEPVNLREISLISKNKLNTNLCKRSIVRTKTNLCESLNEKKEENVNKQPLGKLEGKLQLMFTCKRCNYRNSKTISKIAYEKGVVIVRCEGCKNNHLISDNLGWFAEMQNKRNIERLLAEKGETIRKVQNDVDGYIEVVTKEQLDMLEHNRKWEEINIPKKEEKNESRVQYEKVGTPEKT